MENLDIEKINRNNFKSLMNALARPGDSQKIEPLFGSFLMAISSVFLYSQTSFYYDGQEDMELMQTISNAKKINHKEADYIFSDSLDLKLLQEAKIGTTKEPEFSATLIFTCKDFDGFEATLSGPGIEKERKNFLPIDEDFVRFFMEKNSLFPLGNDIFFVSLAGEVIALSRTTNIRSV